MSLDAEMMVCRRKLESCKGETTIGVRCINNRRPQLPNLPIGQGHALGGACKRICSHLSYSKAEHCCGLCSGD